MLRFIIRADASVTIGSGHVMRCLTIAKGLRELGHEVRFWMEDLPGNLISYVKAQGFEVIAQAEHVDILIVDHYGLDIEWEKMMRAFARKIIVIDDLANRHHDCDLLLDQNMIVHYERRYDELVPEYCKKLLGPAYLIMREEFIEARAQATVRNGKVKRLLVFMGGSDPTGETIKVLDALKQLQPVHEFAIGLQHIDVVVGSSNSAREEIERRCHKLQINYYCQINYLADLMRQADFAIGAGGSAMWERCYVGLPSSSTVVAANQQATTEMAAQLGAVIHLGWHENLQAASYLKLLHELPLLGDKLSTMSKQGLNITGSQETANAWLQEMVGVTQ